MVARSGPQHFGRPGPCRVPLCLPLTSPLPISLHCLLHQENLTAANSLSLYSPHPGHFLLDTFSAVRSILAFRDWLSPLKCPLTREAKQPDAAASQSQRTVSGNSQLTPPASQKPTEAVPEAAEGSWQGSRAQGPRTSPGLAGWGTESSGGARGPPGSLVASVTIVPLSFQPRPWGGLGAAWLVLRASHLVRSHCCILTPPDKQLGCCLSGMSSSTSGPGSNTKQSLTSHCPGLYQLWAHPVTSESQGTRTQTPRL